MGQVLVKLAGSGGKATRLVAFETDSPSKLPKRAGVRELANTARAFEAEFGPIIALAENVVDSLKKLSPGKVEVEFGVELSGSAGIPLVTSGTAKANIKVSLSWENSSP